MASRPTHLRCKNGFVLPDRTVVKVGQVVRANSRVAKLAPDNFEPYDVVESATAAPNERRILPKRNPEAVVMSAAAKRNLRRNALPDGVEAVVDGEAD